MISNFPYIYHDELLYSVLGRYRQTDGNKNIKKTFKELFSTSKIIPIVDLPCHLEELCNNIPYGLGYSSEYFIQYCTLFPLYSPFMSLEKRQECVEIMKYKNGSGIKAKIGAIAGGICRKDGIHYCPECVKDEEDNGITPYIHRLHQVQGVFLCDKHMCKLKVYKEDFSSRLQFICLDVNKIDFNSEFINNISLQQKMVKIVIEVRHLLENDLNKVLCQNKIHERYYSFLFQRGYLTAGKSIKQSKLLKDFIDYYGNEFLSYLDSEIDISNESNWLKIILRRPNRAMHPIRHILLINFLAGNIDHFIKHEEEKKVYLCLNSFCKYYKKSNKTKHKITADYKTREEVVTVSCTECGFKYSRKNSKGIDEIGTIKDFGFLWLDKLKTMLISSDGNSSLRAISKEMGCDCKTVVKYAEKLGVQHLIHSKMMVSSAKETTKNERNEENDYKKSIAEFVKTNPSASITEIKYNRYKEYMWLYKNQKEWLTKHLPKPRKSQNCIQSKVDWNKRDAELLRILEAEYSSIKNSDLAVRITKTLLGRICCKLSYIEKKLDKLPLSSKFINSVRESVEEFQIRRVDKICKELYNKGEPLIGWRIKKLAGLKSNISSRVQQRIFLNISKYINT